MIPGKDRKGGVMMRRNPRNRNLLYFQIVGCSIEDNIQKPIFYGIQRRLLDDGPL